MEDTFQIPLTYQGNELEFDAQLLHLGYINKIQVDVNGVIVFLEKDDEGNYRAIINNLQSEDKIAISLVLTFHWKQFSFLYVRLCSIFSNRFFRFKF